MLDGGPDPPMASVNFEGGKGASHCKLWGHSAVICAKTAEPIEMQFRLWTGMGCWNHVLDESPEVLRDVATATNFGTQFAVTGFAGYNFGCTIASDNAGT